jgi:hypothetical protein
MDSLVVAYGIEHDQLAEGWEDSVKRHQREKRRRRLGFRRLW